MANVLILGGSGFLSGAMARLALADGHAAWTVTRGLRAQSVPGVAQIVVDRKQRDRFSFALKQVNVYFDLVVDCIGFDALDALQDVECFGDPRRAGQLVFISTDSVISPLGRPEVVDESFERFHDSPYAAGKRAAEVTLLDAIRDGELNTPTTILRPGHIYGPGSLLGCLPCHARDPELIDRIARGERLTLVERGRFRQAPIFVDDLWKTALSCIENRDTQGQLLFTPGPETVESRVYFELIGARLGKEVAIDEIGVGDYLREHRENAHFCCDRVYSTRRARSAGLALPQTRLADGIARHVEWILKQRESRGTVQL